MILNRYSQITLQLSGKENRAVKRAAAALRSDLKRALDCRVNESRMTAGTVIHVATAGVEPADRAMDNIGCGLIPALKPIPAGITDAMRAEDGSLRRENYVIAVIGGELWLCGSDRRGTIYAVYEFSEKWLGVSPWTFFADVPVRKKISVEIPEGTLQSDYPMVEYRGVFINDEEELEHWAQRYLGEETIGVRTYSHFFDLLLRLKMNYIWPAMHVNSFNADRANGDLADACGIVVGTSHCDMLMRTNNHEWKPWLERKGYTGAEYDYSIPGENRRILEEYWQESAEQNKDFEVCYTLGMRGIHDSGFETGSLAGLQGKELLDAKISLLESVIDAQEKILSRTLDHPTLKTFIPYKEVLELYDNGLKVPEDLTLVWVNDNYGYVRRYPDEKAKARPAGNGIYYHNSYWAPPTGMDYLFLPSIPLSQTRNELKKAYAEGIRKLWVTNFGAQKPLEQEITFYAQLAWETGKPNPQTDDEEEFLRCWIDRTFSGNHGGELAPLLVLCGRLSSERKAEQMDTDAFSQTLHGDEAAERIHLYEAMMKTGNRVWRSLPPEEQDAFFELVLMRIHAEYYTACMFYYADRSFLCGRRGNPRGASEYAGRSLAFERLRRRMLAYYNHRVADGKWDGILTPEEFAPPRTSCCPACAVPLSVGGPEMQVHVWNGKPALSFVPGDAVKWIEIANAGTGSVSWRIDLPEWLEFRDIRGEDGVNACTARGGLFCPEGTADSHPEGRDTRQKTAGIAEARAESGENGDPGVRREGTTEVEERVLLALNGEAVRKALENARRAGEPTYQSLEGTIRVVQTDGPLRMDIPVSCLLLPEDETAGAAVEDDGMISVDADRMDSAASDMDAWNRIPGLGRHRGALMEAKKAADGSWKAQGGSLTYPVFVTEESPKTLQIHRFPTLNSVGRLRFAVSVDGGEEIPAETEANDEHRSSWELNVRDGVDRLNVPLPPLSVGRHTVAIRALDPYMAFSRLVILSGDVRNAGNLGIAADRDGRLPEPLDPESFGDRMYGPAEEEAVQVGALPEPSAENTLYNEDIIRAVPEHLRAAITDARVILALGREIVRERDGSLLIEAGSALAETAFAFTTGRWDHCRSLSHHDTGIAMLIRHPGLSFAAPEPVDQIPAETTEDYPSLNFRIDADGGVYRIWTYLFLWGIRDSHFMLQVDDRLIPEEELYGGQRVWRYSFENSWKWVPAAEVTLTPGEHLLRFITKSVRLRVDQIWLSRTGDLPPLTV